MTETPKCNYCGEEMKLVDSFVSTETLQNQIAYRYSCEECKSLSPRKITPDEALSAALHRAEPEMRPLTMEEVLELGKDNDSIVYIETRRFGGRGWCQPCTIIFDSSAEGQKNEIHFYEPGNDLPEFWPEAEYGKSWRCWPRKPTPEQMAAAIAQNIDWGSDEKTVAQLGRICDKARAIQRERALYAGEGEEK